MEAGYRTSNTMCCIVGCKNSYSNTDVNIKFYSFPGKWYEKERRQVWINAVRRFSNGEDWELRRYHKVCSTHFVNGEKSNNVFSPSYNPTIFPSVCQNIVMKTKKFEGAQSRFVKKVSTISSKSQDHKEKHYSEQQQCRYFRFPQNEFLRATWTALIGKVPTKHSTVCSCHFENADKNNLPTIFNRKHQYRQRFEASKPFVRKKVSEEGKLDSSTESASETEEMEALIEDAKKAIKSIGAEVHSGISSDSETEEIEGSTIYREHSYSLWRKIQIIEKKKNMQFEFVNCMSETKFLEESDNIFSSSQNIPVKEEVVQSNTSNVTYSNVEHEERINLRDVYLSHVKKETEDDIEISAEKIKQEEIFIKEEIIEEESESNLLIAFPMLQTDPCGKLIIPSI